jgi:hypothetical protein
MKKLLVIALFLNALLLSVRVWQEQGAPPVLGQGPGGAAVANGDTNGDGSRDVSDAVYLLSWLFLGGPAPIACAVGEGGLLTPEQQEILSHLSIVNLPDGQGGAAKTIRLSGVNLQVVNGEDSTETTNGLGNLIVGYEELRILVPPPDGGEQQPADVDLNHRTGSHNVIVGARHDYTGYGGLVAGEGNSVSGQYCSVLGGTENRGSGVGSVVCGGVGNNATSLGTVCGGASNRATGFTATIAGGFRNAAEGSSSAVSGGRDSVASGRFATVSGGQDNVASGEAATVSGGVGLTADQNGAHVP